MVQPQLNNYLLVGIFWFIGQFFGQVQPHFQNYGLSDGLSESCVNTIISADNGLIWAGTQDGLNQFDGFEFLTITKENNARINSAFILCSDKDNQGNLWFGTKRELLFLNTETYKVSSFYNAATTSSLKQVCTSAIGVLCLYENGRLFIFLKDQKKFQEIHHAGAIKQLVKDLKRIHLISNEGDLYVFQGLDKVQKVYSFGREMVYSAFSVVGTMVFCLKEKITVLDAYYHAVDSPLKKFNSSLNAQVVGIIKHKNNYVIGVKGQGLFLMNQSGNMVSITANYYQDKSLKSNQVNCLYKDAEEVIWVGTDRGLSCFKEQEEEWLKIGPSTNPKESLITENVWSFSKFGSTLLIGTDQGISLFQQDDGLFEHIKRPEGDLGLKDVTVMDIEPWSGSSFLVACFDGLFVFDAVQRTFQKFAMNPLLRQKHGACYTLKSVNGMVLVGTSCGILAIQKSNRVVEEVHFKQRDVVRGFLEDSQGKLWAISDEQGLSVLHPLTYKPHPSKFNKNIRKNVNDVYSCLIQPSKNELLIGTFGSGIVRLNLATGKVVLMDKNDGLPNNVVNGLLLDNNGTVWVSTNRGLAYMSSKGGRSSEFSRFGEEDFEYNTNALFNDSGNLFFGGIFGFVRFPKTILRKKELPQYPKIYRVRLKQSTKEWPNAHISLNELIDHAFEVSLPYHRRDFEVFFQPNCLFKSRQMEYKCEIIGETMDTIFLGNTNHISLNALASGTYYLRIYARIGKNGAWTETPALLTIIIEPPFWGSSLFFWIWGFMGAIGTYVYVRLSVAKERKERLQLERLVAERTQEIILKKEEIELKNFVILEEKNKVLEQQKLLYLEKMNAEKWLKNALPEQAVKELQRLGKVRPKSFESATILFTDVVGFSAISETMSPARLVNKLDSLFKKFDAIVKDRNIEKIKTIGDAYMAVGGIPEGNTTHAIDVCLAALLIQDYMAKHKFDALANGKDFWEIRIGINTGPVTAGIIGKLKIAYDVWGAAVNQAQRMEQFAEPGTISISETTFRFIEPYFEVRPRGTAPMKSALLINRYELLRIKPGLSIGGEGLVPNDLFYEISQLHLYSPIKYYSVEAEVLRILEEQLPKNLYYHSVEHTREVIQAVEHLSLCEGVRDEGLFLLKTAALFHDLGFTQQYEHNEPIGAAMAQKILPDFGYSELHIETVKELIFATEVPHKPVNKMQEIMCDADLDYLGTDDFEAISQKLKHELMEKGKITSDRHWDEVQVPFLENHRYFTPTAIASRGPKKEENLAAVRQRLNENKYD